MNPVLFEEFKRCTRVQVEDGVNKSLLSTTRLINIARLLRRTEKLGGDTAEIGSAAGGTSLLIALSNGGARHWACDTFEGLVDAGPEDGKLTNGRFAGPTYASVSALFAREKNIVIVPGYFPESAPIEMREARYRFVHIDVDTYRSILDCFRFFTSRMVDGGIIALDDVLPERSGCPGAQRAWTELLAEADPRWRVVSEVPPQACAIFGV